MLEAVWARKEDMNANRLASSCHNCSWRHTQSAFKIKIIKLIKPIKSFYIFIEQ